MKLHTLIAISAGLGLLRTPCAAQAPKEIKVNEQEVKALGPLPDDKQAETVSKNERNPFAVKIAASTDPKSVMEGEDAKLHTVLNKIPITGIIRDKEARLSVLIGRRTYREGDKLQWLIPGQTSLLRVSKITEKEVEFSWVENQAEAVPQRVYRKLSINTGVIRQEIVLPGGEPGAETKALVPVTTKGEYLPPDQNDEAAKGAQPEVSEPVSPAGASRSFVE
jgi:hypothetical protein